MNVADGGALCARVGVEMGWVLGVCLIFVEVPARSALQDLPAFADTAVAV